MSFGTRLSVGRGGSIFARPATGKIAQSQSDRITDNELVARLAKRDAAAMRSLFARHNVRVFRFVRRLVDDQALAEDILNEVFLEVWRNAAKFRGESEVSTWMLAIARFRAISALRKRREETLDEADAAAIVDTSEDAEEILQNKDRSAIIGTCVRQLSKAHREVIDLVYYHEKSIDEVAKILGIPVNTVKTRMFYARRRMSGLLGQAGLQNAYQ
jgi:RNA polymerase sigma-70 factor (ECF subfamily)